MIEQQLPAELPRREVVINFKPTDPRFTIHTVDYDACWKVQGRRVISAFESITRLPFTEDNINADVGDYNHDHSGHNLTEPMQFRYGARNKTAAITHELTHRVLMQHHLWSRAHEHFSLTEVHQLLDLIYFDVLSQLYGEPAALERVESEKKNKDPKYRQSWEWTMSKTPKERKTLLREIITYATQEHSKINK
jgi:hypothetical protein